MLHTFKTNLGFLLAFCLVGFFIPRSVNAYYLLADRHTQKGDAILALALDRLNLNTVTDYRGHTIPDVSAILNINHFQQYVQSQYPSYDWGSSFDISRLADNGHYSVYCCIWPRSGAVGEFDIQICTFFDFQYKSVDNYTPEKARVYVPLFFYGVFSTRDNITTTPFAQVSWTYVSDNVKFPFFGKENMFYAYKEFKVRQYPIAYTGQTQAANATEISSFAYGTVQELATVFSCANTLVSWAASEQVPVISLQTSLQIAEFNWYKDGQVQFPEIFNWRNYDLDEGTEPDAHEFYVKHDRENPDDDWSEVIDDPSGDYGTVEVGPDTRESYSEKLDEYFGYDESDPEVPDLSNLEGPETPKLLTDYQWNQTDSGLSSAIQNTPIGAVLNNFSSGLGSSGGSSTLPTFAINLPPEFHAEPLYIDFSIVKQEPYADVFSFLRTLVVMFLYIEVILWIFQDIRGVM